MATRVNISRTGFFFFFLRPPTFTAFYRDKGSFLRNRERKEERERERVYRVKDTHSLRNVFGSWHICTYTRYITRNYRGFVSRYRRINALDCIIRENFWELIGERLIAGERRPISRRFRSLCSNCASLPNNFSAWKIWRKESLINRKTPRCRNLRGHGCAERNHRVQMIQWTR